MTPQTARHYKKERAEMWKAYANHPRSFTTHDYQHAKNALARAHILTQWDERQTDAEIAGAVRLTWEPDYSADFEDLCGDCYDPRVNSDISPPRLERQKKAFLEQINNEGVWGLVGEYFDGNKWQHADSCWSFVGQDAHDYEIDIKAATLDAAAEYDFEESAS